MNRKIPSMMSWVAIAARSRPEILISSMIPPGPSIHHHVRQDDRHQDGHPRPRVAARLADRDHDRNDRSGPGQQGRTQGHERDVDPLVTGVRRGGVGSHEELHGDQEEEQSPGELEGLNGDVEEVENLPTQNGKRHDHAEGHRGRLDRRATLLKRRVPAREPQEDRDGPDGVHDDRQGRERRRKQRDIKEAHGSTTPMYPRLTTSAIVAGSVVFSPMRFGLPRPW